MKKSKKYLILSIISFILGIIVAFVFSYTRRADCNVNVNSECIAVDIGNFYISTLMIIVFSILGLILKIISNKYRRSGE